MTCTKIPVLILGDSLFTISRKRRGPLYAHGQKYETKGKPAREGSARWPPTIQSSSLCDKSAYGVSQYSRT